jgi:hypothetical protein
MRILVMIIEKMRCWIANFFLFRSVRGKFKGRLICEPNQYHHPNQIGRSECHLQPEYPPVFHFQFSIGLFSDHSPKVNQLSWSYPEIIDLSSFAVHYAEHFIPKDEACYTTNQEIDEWDYRDHLLIVNWLVIVSDLDSWSSSSHT